MGDVSIGFTVADFPKPAELSGPWEVTFQQGRGSAKAVFEKLISWPDQRRRGSGISRTAAYRKTINVPAERLAENRSLLLDLGSVKEIAGCGSTARSWASCGKPRSRWTYAKAARPGENELEVRVTNLWPNRLIGDEQYPDDCQWDGIHLKNWPETMVKGEPRPEGAFDVYHVEALHKDSPLQPSGLLGPVKLLTLQKVPVQ